MAGSATIGSLRVDLGLNSAQFQAGAKKAQSTLGSLGASFKSFAIGAAAALSFGAVTGAIKSVIDKADELGKLSQKIGIPVAELSKLEYAAKRADVSLGQLQVGVGRLSKSMGEIAGGKLSNARSALSALGISATDVNGKLRPTEDVIGDVAEKFSKLRDGAGKTSIAMALFGKSGADLIPLLNAGRKGLADSAAEAEKLGVVIGGPAAKAAEEFNDNLTRLQEAAGGLLTQGVLPLLPRLVELTDKLVELAKNNDAKAFFEDIAETIATTSREVQKLGILLTVMQENFTKADGMTAALERWRAGFAEIQKINESVGKITANAASIEKLLAGVDTSINLKPAAPIVEDISITNKRLAEIDRLKKAYKSVTIDLGQYIDGVKEEARALGLSDGALARLSESQRVYNSLQDKGVIVSAKQRQEIEAQLDQIPELVTALEQRKSALQTAVDIGSLFESNFSSAFDSIIDKSKSVGDAFEDMAKNILSQLTSLFANRLFSQLISGPAGSGGTGGLVGGLFGGLSNLFGFASGGTIFPGGSGGIDSQLVAFRKSPNERVDITKPGQTLTGGMPKIEIIDQRHNAPAIEQEQRQDGSMKFIIRDAVNEIIGSGQANKAMRGQYGVAPQKVRR